MTCCRGLKVLQVMLNRCFHHQTSVQRPAKPSTTSFCFGTGQKKTDAAVPAVKNKQLKTEPSVIRKWTFLRLVYFRIIPAGSCRVQAHRCRQCKSVHRWQANLAFVPPVTTYFGSFQLRYRRLASEVKSFSGNVTVGCYPLELTPEAVVVLPHD